MNEGALARAIIVILLAGLVYVPLSRGPSLNARSSESSVAVAAGEGRIDQGFDRPASLIGGDDPHGGDVPDALTLLGDFANLDITPPALLQYGEQLVQQIPGGCTQQDDAARTLCREQLAKGKGLLARLAMPDIGSRHGLAAEAQQLIDCIGRRAGEGDGAVTRRTGTCSTASRERVAGALLAKIARAKTGGGQQPSDARETAGGRGVEGLLVLRSALTEALATAVVKQAIVGHFKYQVKFLVATLADACDSFTGGAFDPALESIRRAAESDRYVLDRFFFPDWKPGTSPNQTGSQCTGRLHEQHPGIVLFRRENPASLLVLFTIPETATTGIHPATLVRAVRFITQWHLAPSDPDEVPNPDRTIHIIGPTFSGASASLARTIDGLPPGLAEDYDFDIISGSATSSDNLDTLTKERTLAHGRVRFEATTLPDGPMLKGLDDFLRTIGIEVDDRALLSESNTAYGLALRDESNPASRLADGVVGKTGSNDERKPLELTFPLHISRVRSLSPQAPDPFGPRLQTVETRPLSLEDAQTPIDLVPPLRPDVTVPSAELMLRNLLNTVAQESVRAVGVFATDTRDKLFLTRELRRRVPNALLYTSEGDVLLAHPSATPFTRGMLVVSSYPLYSRNQAWTAADRTRREFPSMFAQGTYNATVLHLRALGSPTLPLSEFGLPFAACGQECVPPVWINVVGRNRLWPVQVFRSRLPVSEPDRQDLTNALYTARRPSGLEIPQRVDFRTPYSTALLFACLTVFALLHVGVFWWGGARNAPRLRQCRAVQRWIDPRTMETALESAERAESVEQSLKSVEMEHRLRSVETTLEHRRSEPVYRRRALLVCFVALTLVYVASAGLFWTWFVFGTRGQEWPYLVGKTVLLMAVFATLLGLLFTTAVVAWQASAEFVSRPGRAREDNRWVRLSRFVYRRGCAVVAGLAVAFGAAYAATFWPPHLWPATPGATDLGYVLFFERATSLTSGVSPLVPVLLFTSAAYLWGAQHLHRLGVARDVRITDQLIAADRGETAPVERASGIPLPTILALVLIVVVAVCGLSLWPRWPVTIEGWLFNHTVFWTVVLLQVLMAAATTRVLHDHWQVRAYLDTLVGSPVVEACQRLPEQVVHPSTLLIRPALSEADLLVRKWTELEERLSIQPEVMATLVRAEVPYPSSAIVVSVPSDEALRKLSGQIQKAFSAEQGTPGLAWRDSRTRVYARLATRELLARSRDAGSPMLVSVFDDIRTRDVAEECLALHTILGLREVFSQMASTAVFIMAAAVLLLAGHTLYPVQPRQTLLAMTWTNIGVACLVGLAGLVAIDRNRVLSTITRMPKGAINLNWALARRVVVFAIIPLLSVVAAQFPELGATVLNLLGPMQEALF